MITKLRPLTIADWDAMPADDGYRYEIIEGELFVSCSPGLTHQMVLVNLILSLGGFLKKNPIGVVVPGPGVILSNFSGVIPDIVFFLTEQRDTLVVDDRLHGPPALVIEILSPGSTNIRCDRVAKLQLYSKHGVPEYWIVDPRKMFLEQYVSGGGSLVLSATLRYEDTLTSTAVVGFSCQMSDIFQR
jgi:Uma2 family endonuclease